MLIVSIVRLLAQWKAICQFGLRSIIITIIINSKKNNNNIIAKLEDVDFLVCSCVGSKQANKQTNEWMNEWMNDWITEWSERTNQRTNERTNERTTACKSIFVTHRRMERKCRGMGEGQVKSWRTMPNGKVNESTVGMNRRVQLTLFAQVMWCVMSKVPLSFRLFSFICFPFFYVYMRVCVRVCFYDSISYQTKVL